MPLLQPFSTFIVHHSDDYDELVSQLDRQVAILFPAEKQFSTKIALFEAFHNSMEHGNYPITIEFATKSAEVMITIKDSGNGFPIKNKLRLIEEKGIDKLLEDRVLEVRGRGIYMMLKTATNVLFAEQGNQVSLTFKTV
ncbi:ATP-binding protein [Halalkalibacter akibai]|uniref:Histidine kinase/HSP90-like ATPase domain-containing protein n=1 Tax=Halalkalibacter akibai (strain ATCC 43226 / DSM 21942 / CIP 109018 / JCM 9157 / 1139) TaxID=1236973 RepID=W4QX62_HALA3|nr:ATP-binding protein [Halalkalibacter akibai]GAE36725.1 hypothetical protein JCM9157_3940 [Halalkalibacter akibai JCM 9157]